MQSSVERSPPTQWPTSDRNRWPGSIGTGGRLQIGMSGRHHLGIGGRLTSESARRVAIRLGLLSIEITPREYVLDYLAHSFPTQLFELFSDGEAASFRARH